MDFDDVVNSVGGRLFGRRPRLGALALALAGGIGAWASPASAAIPGLVRVDATSPSNSSPKIVSVSCPAGKKVIGSGAEIIGGVGEVVIDDMYAGSTYVQVDANPIRDQNGFAGNWSVKAYAMCADPLPGFQIVTAGTPMGSVSPRNVSVSCPVGKKVVGTGFQRLGAQGKATVSNLAPNAALTTVYLTAYEFGAFGTLDTWSVIVYAACADPLSGLERVAATSGTDNASPKSATATCPVGKKATGGGFDLGAAREGGVVDFVIPRPASPAQTYSRAYKRRTVRQNPWAITSYAICATP